MIGGVRWTSFISFVVRITTICEIGDVELMLILKDFLSKNHLDHFHYSKTSNYSL
jgi:hypothetical protein